MRSLGTLRGSTAAVCGLMLLALALRCWGLGDESFWFDEAIAVQNARPGLGEVFSRVVIYDRTPPLYQVILHYWIAAFGYTEFSARLLPAIFGALAVGATHWLGKTAVSSRVGLVAAAIACFSPLAVYYSQECRTYSLLLLLATASMAAFIDLLKRDGWRQRIVYAALTVLLLYAHLYAVIVVASQHLTVAVLHWRRTSLQLRPLRWVAISAIVAVLYLPWIAVVAGWVRGVSQGFWIQPLSWWAGGQAYAEYFGLIAVGPVAALALCAMIRATRERAWAALPVALLAILPVALPVIASLVWQPVFVARYGIAAIGALCVLAAAGAMALPARVARWAALVLIFCSATAWGYAVLCGDYSQKLDWRGAATHIYRHQPDATVAVWAEWDEFTFPLYAERYPGHGPVLSPDKIPETAQHVWLVTLPKLPPAPLPHREQWRQVRKNVFKSGLIVYELVRESPTIPATETRP